LAVAAPAQAGPAGTGTVVLDTVGVWRIHHALAAPVFSYPDGPKGFAFKQKWLNQATSPAPEAWTEVEFDDSRWLRGSALMKVRSASLSRMSLRGKFMVTDPAAVRGLSLSIAFRGGVAVHLNGVEIVRRYLPDGPVTAKTLAEAYPPEAFVTEKGEYLGPKGVYLNGRPQRTISDESQRRLMLRDRTLTDFAIPRKHLRKGVNVLAVQIIRSAYDGAMDKIRRRRVAFGHEFTWDTCELKRIRLSASAATGLICAATRPLGLQAWSSDPLAGDFDLDFAAAGEPVQPIRLTGCRNGVFSGKVVLGSTRPIRNVTASASALAGPGGATIPASAVVLRYATPWGAEARSDGSYHRRESPYSVGTNLLDRLLESPPKEIAVRKLRPRSRSPYVAPVSGAVLPVWVTVRVPSDAKPGEYRGRVSLRVEGEKPIVAPVHLNVSNWSLPDSQDYRTWVELMQSPETLALEYGVKAFSDEHWKLIARSLAHLRDIGSRVLYVPLLARTNLGNDESMVLWIEKGDETFGWDFSRMDRYLDLAEKHMGKPKLIVFGVWDVYLIPKRGGELSGGTGGHRRMVRWMDGHGGKRGLSPRVTVIDPKTGKTETASLPPYSVEKSKAIWRPLMTEIVNRLKRRGLAKTMMVGMVTDARPTKEEVQFFADLAPGVPWVSHGHGGFGASQKLHGITPVGYQACVWYTRFTDGTTSHGKNWGEGSLFGWKQSQLTVAYERNTGLESFPASRWRHFGESNITGGQRGMGRIGLDYWKVTRDSRGRRHQRAFQRFPESQWMNLNITTSVLAPGPDGPVATQRFVAMLEGVQECEARIFVERALTDPKLKARLGADLASRCEALLTERAWRMWKCLSNLLLTGPGWANATGWRWTANVSGHRWHLGSDWQQQTRKLYDLAGEVSTRLGAR